MLADTGDEVSRIQWHPFRSFGSRQTPFDQGASDSPIRITFDDKCLEQTSGDQADSVELLRGFATTALIDGLATIPSELPHLIIADRGGGAFDVSRSDDDSVPLQFSVPDQAALSLATIYGGDPSRPEATELFEAFVRVLPHHELRRDILVSMDQRLLENRRHPLIAPLNVRTPLETARIVGLWLRSRSDFTYRASAAFRATTGRSNFYRELAQIRLGSYWRLHFAPTVGAISGRRVDARMDLSWSVVSRMAQALQALDEVGVAFYGSTEGRDTSERALYHFNYGLLLLNGAVDAFLRLANPLLGVRDSRPSLVHAGYLNKLESNGAFGLLEIAQSPETRATMFLVTALRNLIHEREAIPAPAPDGGPGLQVPYDISIPLWCAAGQLGPVPEFGLSRRTWDRFIRGGVEDVDSEHFEVNVGLYPYLRSMVYMVGRLLSQMADCVAASAAETGKLTAAAIDRWLDPGSVGRSHDAIRLLG